MPVRTFVLFLATLWIVQAAELKADVDFSNYDRPLYEQVVSRIKDKVSQRLGEGPNRHDRYFIVPFAYQNKGNDPEYSHSFISVIRVFSDRKQPRLTPGLKFGQHQDREFEAFTISWLPYDFLKNPNLIVFQGKGARLFPKANTCPAVPGRNFSLEETVTLGANAKNVLVMWGPYEIRKEGFDLGVKRMRLLDKGTIKYRADDRLTRKEGTAINCFHAIAGLDELYPNGGLFGTGFNMWGINGTARVLVEYTNKASYKELLLEPVYIKGDRYGFVYAPTRNSREVYNPVKYASAYRR